MHYNLNTPSDGEIVQRIIEGDVNAFEYLLDRYRALVFAIVMKHIPRNQAEEVAHDIFISTYQSLPTYKCTSSNKSGHFWHDIKRHLFMFQPGFFIGFQLPLQPTTSCNRFFFFSSSLS
jgi:hypothetical protein